MDVLTKYPRTTAELTGSAEMSYRDVTEFVLREHARIYAEAGVDDETAAGIVRALRSTQKWIPHPSEVLERVKSPDQSLEERCYASWRAILGSFGGGQKVPDDERTARGIRACGGLSEIGRCSPDRLNWMYKTFKDAYCSEPETVVNPVLPANVRKLLGN